MSETKLLPASRDAEAMALSAFFLDAKYAGGLCAEMGITPAHFHAPHHQILHGALMDAWANGKPVDVVLMTERLHAAGQLQACGGAAEIANISGLTPTVANTRHHLEVVKEKRALREIIRQCEEVSARAHESDDSSALVAEHMEGLSKIAAQAARGYVSMKKRALDKAARMSAEEVDADYILTGISKLDRESPMKRGDMPVITGQRKAGKSILASTITRNVCAAGGAAFYASLEQPDVEQVDRLIHGLARVPTHRDHQSKLVGNDDTKILKAIEDASKWRLDLRDDVFEITAIIGAMRQAKARWPDLHLAVVDYAQLVRGIRLKGDTREMEVASVSRMLRLAAMELRCAVILLCQVNKDGETRESMAIEQDMTAMWKLSAREEHEDEDDIDAPDRPDIRRLSIPRQRNGRSGICFKMLFQGHIATVAEVEEGR